MKNATRGSASFLSLAMAGKFAVCTNWGDADVFGFWTPTDFIVQIANNHFALMMAIRQRIVLFFALFAAKK